MPIDLMLALQGTKFKVTCHVDSYRFPVHFDLSDKRNKWIHVKQKQSHVKEHLPDSLFCKHIQHLQEPWIRKIQNPDATWKLGLLANVRLLFWPVESDIRQEIMKPKSRPMGPAWSMSSQTKASETRSSRFPCRVTDQLDSWNILLWDLSTR